MTPKAIFLLLVLLSFVFYSSEATRHDQSQFFTLMKASLSGKALSDWDVSGGKNYCNFTGVNCNDQGFVETLNLTDWSLSGNFPADVCSYLPELRVLDISRNNLHGNFLSGIVNCSLLEKFNMSSLFLRTTLPDFSRMASLRLLDLSYNLFTGDFPMSITNLTNLEVLYVNENGELNLWQLPENISKLTKLKVMVFTTCRLNGRIPESIGNMTSLVDLELSGNFLSGHIPKELGLLKNLQQLELYYNQHLSGTIPEELGNLTELIDLDMSVNQLSGSIPVSICRLPKLRVLQLYNNSLTGEIPGVIANSTTLTMLSLYANFLSGQLPQNLGQLSSMIVLDLSENNLTGPLPTEVCRGGKLLYFLVLDNKFSGKLPDSYANCNSLIRFRVSHNYLEGSIPEELLGLPHVSIIDLADNNFTGPFPNSIGNARNLSELFMQNNKVSGVLPPAISRAINLVKIDLKYAYSNKATTKCDVYSFGVVLMELITGKKPVEADFGENKNIVYWVSGRLDTKDGVMEVLDKRLSGSFKDEMIQVLRIAMRCTSRNPNHRPTMNEVVQLLIEADPCKFDSCKLSNKTKEASNVTKIKNQSEV
ncbi:hypothetical protein QUC31_000611 [Theobroma cacao]